VDVRRNECLSRATCWRSNFTADSRACLANCDLAFTVFTVQLKRDEQAKINRNHSLLLFVRLLATGSHRKSLKRASTSQTLPREAWERQLRQSSNDFDGKSACLFTNRRQLRHTTAPWRRIWNYNRTWIWRLVQSTWTELNWPATSRPSYTTQARRRRDSIGCSETRTVSARLVLSTGIPVRLFKLEFSSIQFMCCEQALHVQFTPRTLVRRDKTTLPRLVWQSELHCTC